jgi:hypothetical protein
MIFDTHYLILLLVILIVNKVSTKNLISYSPKLVKSLLTQASSSNVTYDYTDVAGTTKTQKKSLKIVAVEL